jgi:hypothetical protein
LLLLLLIVVECISTAAKQWVWVGSATKYLQVYQLYEPPRKKQLTRVSSSRLLRLLRVVVCTKPKRRLLLSWRLLLVVAEKICTSKGFLGGLGRLGTKDTGFRSVVIVTCNFENFERVRKISNHVRMYLTKSKSTRCWLGRSAK